MGNDLKLRRWRYEDCLLLHSWRLHPDIRRWAGDQSEISLEIHENWFGRFMADAGRYGFILEAAGEPVAQIRFDPAELPGIYRISVSAAPGATGRGYGSRIIRLGCASAEMQKAAALFVAETMVENFPSQKVFQRNGFIEAGPTLRRGHRMLCWLMPSGSEKAGQRLPILFAGAPENCDELRRLMTVTGLADFSDDAGVGIFCDAAAGETGQRGHPVFHLNGTAGRPVLDYASGTEGLPPLPVEFDNLAVAVAQIAATLRFSQRP